MKNISIIAVSLFFAFVVFSCQSNEGNDKSVSGNDTIQKSSVSSIEFEEKFYDFGTVAEGEKVSHTFKFKNTGNSDLLLSSVKASCGCTASNFTKDPVKPGESGIIEVIFNSAGRSGPNHKSLTVVANTDPKTHVLTFAVMVEKAKETAESK